MKNYNGETTSVYIDIDGAVKDLQKIYGKRNVTLDNRLDEIKITSDEFTLGDDLLKEVGKDASYIFKNNVTPF